ncbi:MAG: hypothetical protein R3321_12585, partial [Nitrososphaeraceae archaeon]|nr:hypothetical protein [Nitrososphaeraceae archaeon]
MCHKGFPPGVAAPINTMAGKVKKAIKAKSESLVKAKDDLKSTIASIDKNIEKGFPAYGERELINLRHRIDRNKDLTAAQKKSLLKEVDKEKTKIDIAKEKFKKEAEAKKAKADAEAKAEAEAAIKAKKAAEEKAAAK